MTIEVSGKADVGDEAFRIGTIVPGEFISLSDFSTDVRAIVSVHCYPDNNGGEVFQFSDNDFPENQAVRVIPEHLYDDAHRIGSIASGGVFERNIVTETRKRMQLTFTHVPRS